MRHLAKSPGAAILTTWCGIDENRTDFARYRGTAFTRDGARIVEHGEFDCVACRARVEEMVRDCTKILEAFREIKIGENK